MRNKTIFNPGFAIFPTTDPMGFSYGNDVFGPQVEYRRLDDIRGSLMEPACSGPEIVYAIAMDVGKKRHRKLLSQMHLLYGVVSYAAGKLGREPIRSQGHAHKVSGYSHWSTPEVYEIWSGRAIVYMQEFATDHPGKCFAVYADPGDVVIVPPDWTHVTISANPECPLIFGAWCDREYGFEYEGVRKHHGIAWFPVFNDQNEIEWIPNEHYEDSRLIKKRPGDYKEFGIVKGKPIYTVFEEFPGAFFYVPEPQLLESAWIHFEP